MTVSEKVLVPSFQHFWTLADAGAELERASSHRKSLCVACAHIGSIWSSALWEKENLLLSYMFFKMSAYM